MIHQIAETFSVYLQVKNQLYPHAFLENHNFATYEIGGEISPKILVSILDYFQEKLMTKFFIKSTKKKNYLGAILGPFCPNFGKNEFS